MKKYAIYFIVSFMLTLFAPEIIAQDHSTGSERVIKIETTLGNMVIKLYDETPEHRDNMLKLIEEDFYNGQLFHRVIKDFMVQGGDPHSVGAEKGQRLGTGGPGYTLPAEFNEHLVHKKGALAAARQGDDVNPEKRSSGSQFYIVHNSRGTPHLDGSYTVFGEVVEGLEVLDRIATIQTDSYNRPFEDVVYIISLVR